MKFSLIVAIGQHREIGANNDLLWHLPKDMQFFKSTTLHHAVIMGRKSWESIPDQFRPLPDRMNFVLTRDPNYRAEGAIVIHDLKEVEKHLAVKELTAFIIGGAEIYRLALENEDVNELFITHVQATFEHADAYFPFVNWDQWEEEELLRVEKDEKHAYSFITKRYSR